jgi:hypothetical protein
MRLGLSSIVGDVFGSAGLSVDGPAGPVNFPAAGTILETLTAQTYPISEGGGYVTYNSTQYPNQNADVYRKANGTGGNYLDWANAFNLTYKTGTFTSYSNYSASIIINGTNYGAGCSYYGDVEHDGSGGFNEINQSGGCSYAGSLITSDSISGSQTISTPIGNYAYETWTGNDWFHDGSGGYYSVKVNVVTQGSGAYIGDDGTSGSSSTEVPSGSGNYYSFSSWTSITYYYNGSGGYNSSYQGAWNASYGDYITYDGTYSYYWDGSGGYYY